MAIFFAQYEAVPLPESEEFGKFGGAYINCWVKANSVAGASLLALAVIHERRWRVLSVEEEWRDVTDTPDSEDAEARAHHEQAAIDGECYVFHQWLVDSQLN